MKSSTNHKKAHPPAKSNHKPPQKIHKADGRAESKAERPEKGAAVVAAPARPAEAELGKPGRAARTRKGAAPPVAVLPDEQPKTRLALIKARHEAMKREIDQIREDLESDEDE